MSILPARFCASSFARICIDMLIRDSFTTRDCTGIMLHLITIDLTGNSVLPPGDRAFQGSEHAIIRLLGDCGRIRTSLRCTIAAKPIHSHGLLVPLTLLNTVEMRPFGNSVCLSLSILFCFCCPCPAVAHLDAMLLYILAPLRCVRSWRIRIAPLKSTQPLAPHHINFHNCHHVRQLIMETLQFSKIMFICCIYI